MRQTRLTDFIDRALDQSRRALAPYVPQARVAEAAEAVLSGIIAECGGQQFYVPTRDPFTAEDRDAAIFDRYEAARYQPGTVRALSAEYGMHPISIFRVIARERRRRWQCRNAQRHGVTAQ